AALNRTYEVRNTPDISNVQMHTDSMSDTGSTSRVVCSSQLKIYPPIGTRFWIPEKEQADHLPASHAADPTTTATSADSTIAGKPKYRKLSTTPPTCTPKNAQPRAPIVAGADRANSPRCQDRNAQNTIDTVLDKPKPR